MWPLLLFSIYSGACDNCHQRPGYFDKLRPCAGCRQRICKGCASRRKIFKLDWHTKKVLTEQFCMLCVTEVSNRPVLVHHLGSEQHSSASMSESNYENQQHQQNEYEGNERLSKHRGLPSVSIHRRGTGMSSTFTQSTLTGRPSQQLLRPTILEEQEEQFALTEANLRTFELGMSISNNRNQLSHPLMDVEVEEVHKIIGPEDLSTTGTEEPILMMDAGGFHHPADRYHGVDAYNNGKSGIRGSQSQQSRLRPSRASV